MASFFWNLWVTHLLAKSMIHFIKNICHSEHNSAQTRHFGNVTSSMNSHDRVPNKIVVDLETFVFRESMSYWVPPACVARMHQREHLPDSLNDFVQWHSLVFGGLYRKGDERNVSVWRLSSAMISSGLCMCDHNISWSKMMISSFYLFIFLTDCGYKREFYRVLQKKGPRSPSGTDHARRSRANSNTLRHDGDFKTGCRHWREPHA